AARRSDRRGSSRAHRRRRARARPRAAPRDGERLWCRRTCHRHDHPRPQSPPALVRVAGPRLRSVATARVPGTTVEKIFLVDGPAARVNFNADSTSAEPTRSAQVTEFVAETPALGRSFCPGCEPDADPTLEILDVRWCDAHLPHRDGTEDPTVRSEAFLSGS